MSQLEAGLPIDSAQRTLYGHSYGGLFTLYTLCQRPGLFRRYVAASPSLWWRDEHIIRMANTMQDMLAAGRKDVLLLVGQNESWHPLPAGSDPRDPARRLGQPTLPMAEKLAGILSGVSDMTATLEILRGLDHASMLGASAQRALLFAT